MSNYARKPLATPFMQFLFNAYSSPLLFGFVQAWVYAISLWVRGRREERLSDILLGWVLVGMGLNIWEYMLGFGGIEILWRELEFFPRTLGYLFPALCYFYLKSQTNADFRFSRRDAWHAVPFLLFVTYHVTIFSMGSRVVDTWKTTVHYPYHIEDLEFAIGIGLDIYYLVLSLKLYRLYRTWIKTQFSETETISFRWFRNFLIALIATTLFGLIVTFLSIAFGLNYWQDWWDELAVVVLIYYVSINGYAQVQSGRQLTFSMAGSPLPVADLALVPVVTEPELEADTYVAVQPPVKESQRIPDELRPLRDRLLVYMTTEKPYLEPELSLANLARRLHTNPVVLSQVINTGAGKNFNDFVNQYRVEEFKRQVQNPANAHLSFLGLALDCGFNSKATFNRAFRKGTGQSPGEFLAGAE